MMQLAYFDVGQKRQKRWPEYEIWDLLFVWVYSAVQRILLKMVLFRTVLNISIQQKLCTHHLISLLLS